MTYDSIIHYISIHAGAFAAAAAFIKEMEWDKPIKDKINETIKFIYRTISVWIRRKWAVSRQQGKGIDNGSGTSK